VIDTTSFLVIVGTAALAGVIATTIEPRFAIPVVVLELLLGIVVGPEGADIAKVDASTQFFSNLGLGMLFFFAGYEIDFERIKGSPLARAAAGWAVSLALAYSIAGLLEAGGIVISGLYTGSAMATTAIGTLIPILSDSGELRSRFGTFLLAAGAVGEFGPILLLTLILTTQSALHEAAILLAFIALAVGVAVLAVRSAGRTLPFLERGLESSSQLMVRWIVVLVFSLVLIANDLGLDLLLGGFAAGLITREILRGHEVAVFDSKLTAVAFGFFIPFFFVVSGMGIAINALFESPSGIVKLFVFLGLFLVVRASPPPRRWSAPRCSRP
jgi:Kef-type K+ transport system membrane component KefB